MHLLETQFQDTCSCSKGYPCNAPLSNWQQQKQTQSGYVYLGFQSNYRACRHKQALHSFWMTKRTSRKKAVGGWQNRPAQMSTSAHRAGWWLEKQGLSMQLKLKWTMGNAICRGLGFYLSSLISALQGCWKDPIGSSMWYCQILWKDSSREMLYSYHIYIRSLVIKSFYLLKNKPYLNKFSEHSPMLINKK